jgi:hypothetical protein
MTKREASNVAPPATQVPKPKVTLAPSGAKVAKPSSTGSSSKEATVGNISELGSKKSNPSPVPIALGEAQQQRSVKGSFSQSMDAPSQSNVPPIKGKPFKPDSK